MQFGIEKKINIHLDFMKIEMDIMWPLCEFAGHIYSTRIANA